MAEHTGKPQPSQQPAIERLWIDRAGTQALMMLSQPPRADVAPRVS